MSETALPLLKGTVDMLVLKALSWGPMHGFGIALWLEEHSAGTLGLDDSMTYQVLHRLEGKGHIAAKWRITENKRRARFYTLTADGQRYLADQAMAWQRYSSSVTGIMSLRTRPA
ncbi:MAG: PadR family transcriptional regulator [Gemmatimonadales bacterium]|nr:PadR family transcriptional regulator [Gemmatimonadales bacterium]